jgi:tetratricopeptide (TPR) repeat protein
VEKKESGAIDYDEPVTSERSTTGLGTKIGVGVAVLVFGFVFALGDFLPSGSPTVESTTVNNELSPEAKANLEASLQKFQDALKVSPTDPIALEGAAVNLAELGEYKRAASLLEELTEEKPNDPEVFRLLGETKYEAKDYDGSAAAFKTSATVNYQLLMLRRCAIFHSSLTLHVI